MHRIKRGDLMIKNNYEQFCTHLDANVIIEEIIYSDGTRETRCTCEECKEKEKECKNKLNY